MLTNTQSQIGKAGRSQQKNMNTMVNIIGGLEMLDILDLSRILKLSCASIRRMVARRDLPFYRTKRKILFKASDIDCYLSQGKTDAADPESYAG